MAKLAALTVLLALPLLALAQSTASTTDVASTTTTNAVATSSQSSFVTTTNTPVTVTPPPPSSSIASGNTATRSKVIPTDNSFGYGSPSNTILQNIAAVGLYLQIPLGLPKYSSIASILNNPSSNITFFAPSDLALSIADRSGDFNWTKTQNYTNILQYHIGEPAVSSFTVNFDTDVILKSFFNNDTYISLGTPGASQVLVLSNSFGSLTVKDGGIVAKVIRPDIKCTNGYLHIVDQVLLPPVNAIRTFAAIPELSIMASLLEPNNATGAVSGQGITIFAPSNAAWTAWNYASRPLGILNREIKYLVVSGVYYSSDFKDGQALQVISGQYLHINVAGNGTTTVNGVPISRSNIITSNGVIHIVPEVLDFSKASDTDMNFTTRYLGTAPTISPTGKSSATRRWGESVIATLWGAIVVATVMARLV